MPSPEIKALDYNTIRNKVISVLGTGAGPLGYGQTLASSAVFTGNEITKAQWDNLRYDLTNIKIHQDGILPPIVSLTAGEVIRFGAGYPNNNYDTIADQAILAKFNIGSGQSVVSTPDVGTGTPGVVSRTGTWSTQSQCTMTVTFSTANEARYFFNSGGRIRFTSARTDGSSSPQNNAWTNLLNSVGTVQFGAEIPVIENFYTLTTSYQTIYQLGSSTPYSSNYYEIAALCNCSDATNANGTASTITFRITWRDDHTGTIDATDGTLSLNIEEFKALGPMLPTGNFTIDSPSYSLSTIAAT